MIALTFMLGALSGGVLVTVALYIVSVNRP